jgi:hypothetical protein
VHFLMIDKRFGAPIFVFLENEPPPESGGPRGRWVNLEVQDAKVKHHGVGFASVSAIGGDPERRDRFAEFVSDGAVRAAGFALIEPRYVGPSWDMYLSVFHPEGGKRNSTNATSQRARVGL